MTSSAFPFLDGRSALDGPLVRMPDRRRRRSRGVLEPLCRLRSTQRGSVRHDHAADHDTDAYLDRTGLSSFDWHHPLARQAQR